MFRIFRFSALLPGGRCRKTWACKGIVDGGQGWWGVGGSGGRQICLYRLALDLSRGGWFGGGVGGGFGKLSRRRSGWVPGLWPHTYILIQIVFFAEAHLDLPPQSGLLSVEANSASTDCRLICKSSCGFASTDCPSICRGLAAFWCE